MGELEKTPLIRIIEDLERLNQDIGIKIIKYEKQPSRKLGFEIDLMVAKYNLLIMELYRRFPFLQENEELQPKKMMKKKGE